MTSPLATVAFVPREVFSTTQRSLDRLLAVTTEPHELVVVDGGSPPDVAEYLAAKAREYDFTLVRCEETLTPNQARNLAARYVRTKYVVFVDNDVLPTAGWLAPLVECAEQTGAWVVGPKCYEHEPECARLHMYGGVCRIEVDDQGRRTYTERHHFAHQLEAELHEPLTRCETELIEFHAALVAMEAFATLGPLDEGYLCSAEHGDLCLAVRAAGKSVYLEPASQITYIPPRRLTPADRAFFTQRWSEARQIATVAHMNRKHNLSPHAAHNRMYHHWVSGHRRYSLLWLNRLRKRWGAKSAHRIEKWFVAPVENWLNRRRYPLAQYGRITPPAVRIVHRSPAAHALAAA